MREFERKFESAVKNEGVLGNKEEYKTKEWVNIEGEKIPKEELVEVIANLSKRRKISREELSPWVESLIKTEKAEDKQIEINKTEYGADISFRFGGISIRTRTWEKDKVTVSLTRGDEFLASTNLDKESSKELLDKIGILDMVRKGGYWITLKKGRENSGFEHIYRKHFEEFERKLKVKDEEELKELITSSVKNGRIVEEERGKVVYRHKKGDFYIYTVVNPLTNSIITSYVD